MKMNLMNTFSTRVRGSQIGAWASKQSSQIVSRKYLLDKFDYFSKKFEDKIVPRPKYWVGIKIVPVEFEFWEGESLGSTKERCFFLKKVGRKKFFHPSFMLL